MPTNQPAAHIVFADRRGKMTSPSCPPVLLTTLEAAFKAPWYRDRWAQKSFRTAALSLPKDAGAAGVAFVGPWLGIDACPPPFDQPFEPILLGSNDPQLRVLSGEQPTRHERQHKFIGWFFGVIIAFIVLWAFGWWFRTGSTRIAMVVLGMIAVAVLTVLLVAALSRLGRNWYIVPGGLAIARRRNARNASDIAICTPRDSSLAIRLVSNGKVTYIALEVWNASGDRFHRPISDREALSILSAWQSPLRPPTAAQMTELIVMPAANPPAIPH